MDERAETCCCTGGDTGSEGSHTAEIQPEIKKYNPPPSFFFSLVCIDFFYFILFFKKNNTSWTADAWRHRLGLSKDVNSEINQQRFYRFEPQLSQLMSPFFFPSCRADYKALPDWLTCLTFKGKVGWETLEEVLRSDGLLFTCSKI